MEKRIVECVPNFSEGRDMSVIKQITDSIEGVAGVKLLDVDPGWATNRTVVTFVGEVEAVVEAAFLCVVKAAQLIDMRKHHGEHPRMGATDVCPLIPVSGISMDETASYARRLAERIAVEAGIPVYCYEYAALRSERKKLAVCREGEYEGLKPRFGVPEQMPDFGGEKWTDRVALTGCTAVGARDFLIAINFNLNTTSTRRANAIAFDVRERGRVMREGGSPVGRIMKDDLGRERFIPGSLKSTAAIGWFIKEYGIAQVSMNITNVAVTPVHVAFEEVVAKAAARGVRVTGTEIVGLIPKSVLLDAGRYFLRKQQRSLGIPEQEIIRMAVLSMGLDDLKPFDVDNKVIEYMLDKKEEERLVDRSVTGFILETASESPAPGGGSIAAVMGALGAALGTMVANLSAHKPGWDDRWEEFSDVAVRGQELVRELLYLVDEDTRSFNKVMEAFGLPKNTAEEKQLRTEAIQEATFYATQVPFRVMKASMAVFDLAGQMAQTGNPNSVSDAGVGALAARAAVLGAWLNVRINAASIKDRSRVEDLLKEAAGMAELARQKEDAILEIVNAKI